MRIGVTGTKTFENKMKIKNFMFKLKEYGDDITIVGLGERDGADKYVKRYALDFGYTYKEANPPHTPQNLYSLLSEMHYNKPYSPKNFFSRNKIYAQYVDKCVVFDDTNLKDIKVVAIVNAMTKAKKRTVLLN
jgi:hypothetical protein